MDPLSQPALAQQNTFGRALLERVQGMGGSLLGGGMAGQAANTIQSQPYLMHVREAQAQGQTPMTPEEFQVFMQGQRQPPQLGR
jgi:hypothetical protein